MLIVPYSGFSLLQVGCGGTGGYLVPKVARLLMTLKQFRSDCLYGYNLVDFDIVETDNLYRQNFVEEDLGQHKSSVLARRYGTHFGVDIGSSNIKAEDYKELIPLFPAIDNHRVNILIGCVDNVRLGSHFLS